MQGGFVVLLTLSATMSGIVNLAQNCFLSSLVQAMSVNESLFLALSIHSRSHVDVIGKYFFYYCWFQCKINESLQAETAKRDFKRRIQKETSIGCDIFPVNVKQFTRQFIISLGSGSRCILCELRDLLNLLRAHIPTTVGEEYISNFCEGEIHLCRPKVHMHFIT